MDQKQKGNSLPKGLGERLAVAIVQMSHLNEEPVNIYGDEFSRIKEKQKNLLTKINAAIPKVSNSQSQDTLESVQTLHKRILVSISDLNESLDAADNLIWQRIEKSLQFARKRGANIIVFPELSIHWKLLKKVDKLCKALSPAADCDQPLLVVAGSHYAEPGARKTYSQLGLTAQPEKGAFAPVYTCWESGSQREWHLIPKVKPSGIELSWGKDWSLPIDSVCRTIDFGNFKIAILICSDFIDPAISVEEMDGVSVILVPAYNEKHQNFEGYFQNHWSNHRKTVYANNSIPGNSKTTCTDRICAKSGPGPFTLNTVMHMLPSLNEAVMVHSIVVGNKEIRDKLVAVAPMIPSKEFPKYCQFYKKYSGENKQKQVKQFKKGSGLADTTSQVDGKACYKLFSEKLSELDYKDPENLCEKELDLLVDVIPLDGPEKAARRVIKLLDECKIDILDLAKLLQGENQSNARVYLRQYVALILDSIKLTQKKTLALIREIEAQSKLSAQSQKGERIQELKMELLKETFHLHYLLAWVDEFLELQYEEQ